MAGINVDMEHVIVDSQEMEKEEEVKPQKTKRVASLDIFRGLTVAVSLTHLSLLKTLSFSYLAKIGTMGL